MLERIRGFLQAESSISAFTLIEQKTVSTQSYMSFGRHESVRKVDERSYLLELFTKNEMPDGRLMTGSSRLEIASDEAGVQNRIQAAIGRARLQNNPLFELPRKGMSYPAFDDSDPQMTAHPWEVIDQLSDRLQNVSGEFPRIKISSSEFFLASYEYRLINHHGLDLSSRKSNLLWDIVLFYDAGETESEFWAIYSRPGLRYFALEDDFRQFARYAVDAARARVPDSGECPVILTGDALCILLQFFQYHSAAASKFEGSSLFKLGKPVLKNEPLGDAMTMYSNAILEGGTHSYRFDHDGLPGIRTCIIRDGILEKFWATKQYADYLGVEPTGSFANFEIPPGSMPWEEMLCHHDRVILIVQFSTFDPQPVSGNYMGEIRVGYEYRKDGSVIPLRGGSVSGNVADGLLNCRFSRETETFMGYHGPKGVRFEKAQVAGD